ECRLRSRAHEVRGRPGRLQVGQDPPRDARSPELMGSLVQLRNLSKTWPDNGVKACDAVSLDIEAGEVLALLGENGAGKSTLMGLLAGTISPDAGRVILDGRVLGPKDGVLDLGIALVPQHPPFSPELTLWEHALLGAEGTCWLGP